MKYKTLSAVLEALANDERISRDDVAARVLDCHVWVYGAGSPGCLYDSGPYYARSKADAIAGLLGIADCGDGAPRGMRAELERNHSYYANGWHYGLSRDTLWSIL